jgi:hypothetical protein
MSTPKVALPDRAGSEHIGARLSADTQTSVTRYRIFILQYSVHQPEEWLMVKRTSIILTKGRHDAARTDASTV